MPSLFGVWPSGRTSLLISRSVYKSTKFRARAANTHVATAEFLAHAAMRLNSPVLFSERRAKAQAATRSIMVEFSTHASTFRFFPEFRVGGLVRTHRHFRD